MAEVTRINPDVRFIREVRRAGGDTLKKCYQCATCSVVCNLSSDYKPFPRKEMIMAQWGQSERLMQDSDLWACYQCNDCSVQCPRGARPGDVMAAIRADAYKRFAFPSFMGKALADPRLLPILLLVPVLVLLIGMSLFAPRTDDGIFVFQTVDAIDYNLFLPHSTVDAIFVAGNLLIFIFAAFGFVRFWNMLKRGGGERQMSFWKALWPTLKLVFNHGRFFNCDANLVRGQAHVLVFAGFIGAMITTGMVFLFAFIPHYLEALGIHQYQALIGLPLDLPHPVKILGAVSGSLMVLGTAILILRRWADRDRVGANGYSDYLFLYMIFFVGLTGMLSWLTRQGDSPMLAYLIYFVHLVTVWFLLWYMPYSKFAHMIYRTLGLVYARMIGRTPRTEIPEAGTHPVA